MTDLFKRSNKPRFRPGFGKVETKHVEPIYSDSSNLCPYSIPVSKAKSNEKKTLSGY